MVLLLFALEIAFYVAFHLLIAFFYLHAVEFFYCHCLVLLSYNPHFISPFSDFSVCVIICSPSSSRIESITHVTSLNVSYSIVLLRMIRTIRFPSHHLFYVKLFLPSKIICWGWNFVLSASKPSFIVILLNSDYSFSKFIKCHYLRLDKPII